MSDTTNRAKFRRAYDEHFDAVSRYCHRRLPAADANDATAEVFVVAWKKIGAMPDGRETLPWLYAVARNVVSTSQRSARRLGNLRAKLGAQAHHPEPGPEAVVVRNEEQSRLLEALTALRSSDQEVIRLRAFEHLSLDQVATVLGCSVEAAKKRSARAMKRLRHAAELPLPKEVVRGSRAIQEGGDG